MKNKKIILSSILSLVLCLSVIAGATFALFTSESGVNVAINSGKVEVSAHAENLYLYSPTCINTDGTVADGTNAATGTTFQNGGTATITNGNEIVLDRMTPGDKVTFDIVVKNNSSVTIQYQTKIALDALDKGIDLFSGLKVTLEKDRVSTEYDGMTAYSQWATLKATGEVERTTVTIELPTKAGKEYQDLSCKLAFSVSAVQGNTNIEKPEENTVYIYNATDLLLFAKSVNNGNGYSGQTVKLMDDIDLAGIEWKPIGQTSGYSARAYFQGTFDGNGKTISNLNVPATTWEAGSNDGENFATGFFGFIDAGGNTIKNVTFDNAKVEGHHWVGVVAGYMTGTVSGVKVTNSTVTSTYENDKADGDKAGAIVGYLNQAGSVITGCTVENCVVSGVRDCGGIVGFSVAGSTTSNNTVKDTTVYYSTDKDAQIGGEIMGKRSPGANSNNTHTNVTVTKFVTVSTADELSSALNATYNADTTILLTDNINLAGFAWGAHALNGSNNAQLTIDGNGKTIYGLTSSKYYKINGFDSNGLVTSIKSGLSSVTFKNLTIDGANLTNNGETFATTGVFVGDSNTVNITFDTCTVKGANVNSYKYAGGFIGYTQDVYGDRTIKFTNCVVSDSHINTTDSSAGGLVGQNYTNLDITGCKILGATSIKCAEVRSGTVAKAGYLIGTATKNTVSISNITVDGSVSLDTMGCTTYDTAKYIGRNYGTVTGVTPNS